MFLRKAISAIAAVGLMACSGSFLQAADTEPLVFRFNPPDSISFTVDIRSDRTRWIDSTESPVDSSVSTVRRTIRRSGSGWSMTSRPTSIVTTSGGRATDNPINRILLAAKATSVLDSSGVVTSVSGYDGIPHAIDSLASGPMAGRLKEMLSPTNLSAKEEMEWNGKIQGLHGKPVRIGYIEYEKAEYPLPGGAHIPFLVAIRVVDTVRFNGKLHAVLLMSADSDPNKIAERLNRPSDEIALEFPISDSPGMAIIKGGSRYMSESEIILEITTLLPYSEKSGREIRLRGEPGSGPQRIRMVEHETRQYKYH
ncbi:MAG: hypothetical protein HY851_01070 [candidate division Zixibacteria bacterium]|nr:hypothetical protein [candidate division Zixibacteria bacterium]